MKQRERTKTKNDRGREKMAFVGYQKYEEKGGTEKNPERWQEKKPPLGIGDIRKIYDVRTSMSY